MNEGTKKELANLAAEASKNRERSVRSDAVMGKHDREIEEVNEELKKILAPGGKKPLEREVWLDKEEVIRSRERNYLLGYAQVDGSWQLACKEVSLSNGDEVSRCGLLTAPADVRRTAVLSKSPIPSIIERLRYIIAEEDDEKAA